jgi:hypothetical protein
MVNPADMSDARYAQQRGSVLARELPELRRPEAEAIAWSELGFSRGGMSKEDRLDTNADTVKTWHEKAMALYGLEVLEQHVTESDDNLPVYERVDVAYLDELEQPRLLTWLSYVDRQQNSVPVGWVNEILDEAQERGLMRELRS